MSEKRPDLPYEKAVEETAKAVGKVADIIDKASPALADFYNLVAGDRISEQRIRNADKYKRETKRLMNEREIKDKRPVPEELAAALIEAAIRDPREELQKLYAALTVNAIDPAFQDHVRPEFVDTVKRWQPIDVHVMQYAVSRPAEKPHFGLGDAQGEFAGVASRNAVTVSVEHLMKLGCLNSPGSGSFTVSPYGVQIMRAVSEHPTAASSSQ